MLLVALAIAAETTRLEAGACVLELGRKVERQAISEDGRLAAASNGRELLLLDVGRCVVVAVANAGEDAGYVQLSEAKHDVSPRPTASDAPRGPGHWMRRATVS